MENPAEEIIPAQNNGANGEGGDQNDEFENGLRETIEKKEEQILKMEASVFQLANYYFVFSGVILTYKETLDQLDDRTLILYQRLHPRRYRTMYREHRKKKVRRKAIMVLSMILFLIFTALNLQVATRIILCT
ncbi:hypothetical protein CDL12_25374 [Handroanthus impetiginosus]|uniref:Uncharacterized protein n=1 Tax=Handroanthus impetiginosus TaxID=429701 RepID=A0A2G9GA61_9LAMI|nr:hypothetical protein CDL12_25374 [Handroanthus impetiginosus]